MPRFEAFALSFRPGQVRLCDLLPQVGDAKQFIVRALDIAGAERELRVGLTTKWGAGSWRWELQCHGCHGAARVLHVARDVALCSRCSPQLTPYQRHKRAGSWSTEGAIADQLVKAVLAGNSSAKRKSSLMKRLSHNATARAAVVLDNAVAIVRAVDNAGLLDP